MPSTVPAARTDPAERTDISAFLDGELEATEARRVIDDIVSDQTRQDDFRTYCLIGDALRGQDTGPVSVSADFLSRVSARLTDEPTVLAPGAGRKLAAGWAAAMAASIVAVGLVVALAWERPETVTVLRASLEDAHTKALLESHGSMIVRLRMTQEEDRP